MTGTMTTMRHATLPFLLLIAVLAAPTAAQDHGEDEGGSRFSDEPIPLADLPERPNPILEFGEPFLGTGTLSQGIHIPGGAVWQPSFLAFGTLRTAVQGIDDGVAGTQLAEGVGRFDLFGNLYLTPSERIVVGFRPLDQDGRFTRFTLHQDPEPDEDSEEFEEDFEDELNFGIRTLFFEGDFGELFPNLDRNDSGVWDLGISVGRQPLSLQDGLLLNEDALDMVGLTRANIKAFGTINTRITGLFGWGEIDRPMGSFNAPDEDAMLFGLMTETDTYKRTIELDVMYVTADDSMGSAGSGVYAGLGSTRRIGHYNNTFRVVGSFPAGDEGGANRQGVLVHNQLGWTPHHSYNYVYINTFVGINEFRSAVRGPSAGGPLGRTGILYAAVGLGRFGSALGNRSDRAVGGSVGYQMFFAKTRQQLILEGGGTFQYSEPDEDDPAAFVPQSDAVAGAARYQIAVGRRGVVVLDGFTTYNLDESEMAFGGRFEILIKL